jgi:RHS repeat-associated protein
MTARQDCITSMPRYYNPQWGRFINADSFGGVTGGLLSHNIFAYCLNNPVMYCDPSGNIVKFSIEGSWYGFPWYSTEAKALFRYYEDAKKADINAIVSKLPDDERKAVKKAIKKVGIDNVIEKLNADGSGTDIIIKLTNAHVLVVLSPISAVEFINSIRDSAGTDTIIGGTVTGACTIGAIACPPVAVAAVIGGLITTIDVIQKNKFADTLEQNYDIDMAYNNTTSMTLLFGPGGIGYIKRIP